MSSWIETLKSYHTEHKSKYRIPKKDSEEYQAILKYHQSRLAPNATKEPIKNEISPVKTKRVYKKKPKALKVDIPTKKTIVDGNSADNEDCFSE